LTSWAAYIGLLVVLLGIIGVSTLRIRVPFLRSFFNWVFVVGFALIVIGIDEIGSLSLDLIAIGFCVFWIYTRIMLSVWDHDRICRGCGYGCEAAREGTLPAPNNGANKDHEAEEYRH